MKKVLFVCVCLSALATAVHGETMYVNDVIKITFRTGPGIGHKVIQEIASGQKVEVLREEGGWTQVRLPDGKTGWVLNRFLTRQTPNEVELSLLKEKQAELLDQVTELSGENDSLNEQNQALQGEVAAQKEQLAEISRSHEALKEDCADFLRVRAAHEKAEAEARRLREKAAALEEELGTLKNGRSVRWFLSGAGVILVGFLLGRSARRQRRRTSYL